MYIGHTTYARYKFSYYYYFVDTPKRCYRYDTPPPVLILMSKLTSACITDFPKGKVFEVT